MKKLLLILAFSILLVSCAKEISDPTTLIIAAFNIQWLGDGDDDKVERTDEDYKRIAKVIGEVDADIMGLQEIENTAALQKVMKYLPDYYYSVGMQGESQNLAAIIKKDVNARIVGEYTPLEVVQNKTRPGLIIEGYKDNFDFYVMVVHFKSTSRYDSTNAMREASIKMRLEQSRVVSDWADSVISSGSDDDIFIIGDFNDTPVESRYNSLKPLTDNPKLFFENSEMKSCRNASWYVIDHIVSSQTANMRMLPNSARMYNFFSSYPEDQAEKISDHCPVSVTYDVTAEDND